MATFKKILEVLVTSVQYMVPSQRNSLMFKIRRKLLVGIDIGTHSIKVVRLKQKGKGYQLLNFGIMPLRPQAIVDGNIVEIEAIVEGIRNLMRMEKIKAKEVATAVS